jgi:large subunit ribosomal protein L6
MSRVGKVAVPVVKGVTVTISEQEVAAKGPKGQLSVTQNASVQVVEENGALVFTAKDSSRKSRSAHGLMRALCANMVHGVSQGFERKLEINGVGYRAEAKGDNLILQLGYSHPIEYKLPSGISAKVEKNIITLTGIDKQLLGEVAAKVRSFRPPEPYKGKGVKYVEEQLLRKVGKAAG